MIARRKTSKAASSGDRFRLVKKFNIIVPKDFSHDRRLDNFKGRHGKEFSYYNEKITDENFKKTGAKLNPGQKLKVSIFEHNFSGITTSEERLEFLKSQNAILTGPHGASLVFEKAKDKLPEGFWYVSFDDKESLWQDSDGRHALPVICVLSGQDFRFRLGYFEFVWHDIHHFFCITEAE